MPRLAHKKKMELRFNTAMAQWDPLIKYASNRYTIAGRNDPDDLRQEGLLTLLALVQEHPDWDPVSTEDFGKVFKTMLFHRMNDLCRTQRFKKRDVSLDLSLTELSVPRGDAESQDVSVDFEDRKAEYDAPDLHVVGHDLYNKVRGDLEPMQQLILSLLIHPPEEFLDYYQYSRPREDYLEDLAHIREYLLLGRKEMNYHMARIRQVAERVQLDYTVPSLFSVIHMLALEPEYTQVPYWCLYELLDVECRRLLTMMVFSDMPTNITMNRLSNMLNTSKAEASIMFSTIGTIIRRLFRQGVRVSALSQESMECGVHGCRKPAYYLCYETLVRICENHSRECKYNSNHRVVPAMRAIHQKLCKNNLRAHAR